MVSWKLIRDFQNVFNMQEFEMTWTQRLACGHCFRHYSIRHVEPGRFVALILFRTQVQDRCETESSYGLRFGWAKSTQVRRVKADGLALSWELASSDDPSKFRDLYSDELRWSGQSWVSSGVISRACTAILRRNIACKRKLPASLKVPIITLRRPCLNGGQGRQLGLGSIQRIARWKSMAFCWFDDHLSSDMAYIERRLGGEKQTWVLFPILFWGSRLVCMQSVEWPAVSPVITIIACYILEATSNAFFLMYKVVLEDLTWLWCMCWWYIELKSIL